LEKSPALEAPEHHAAVRKPASFLLCARALATIHKTATHTIPMRSAKPLRVLNFQNLSG